MEQFEQIGSNLPSSNEEIIDVEEFTKNGKIPSEGKWYRIRVGDQYYVFLKQFVTGDEILMKVGIHEIDCVWLYQKMRDCNFERVGLKDKVNLAHPGIEHFIIKPAEVFHYFVDDEPETTDQKEMTPTQILEAAGITPASDYYLIRIDREGNQESFIDRPDQPIRMVCPAIKFVSVFRGETPVS